ncbi:solute carrier family 35 member G1-like [Centruroides sculpturatus]|uniref:solute carrier family 35 member G1-like n=1 Tax=Centruroides sculpturatus TaxID=218467 RepID=UPI000C6EB8BA|nr:solute carrier family 35 member G1-like [Centruroides sculpturatus]
MEEQRQSIQEMLEIQEPILNSLNKDPSQRKKRNFFKNYNIYKGLIYSCISSLFFTLSAVIVKYVKEIHPGQLATMRFLAIFIFSLPMMIYFNQKPLGPKKLRFYLLLRGIIGASGLFLTFMAYRFIPLADASVIIFSTPVFVGILAKILLKEPFTMFYILILLLTFLGMLLITKVPLIIANRVFIFDEYYTLGMLSAFGCILLNAGVYVLVRKIKEVHYSVVTFSFGCVATIETSIITVAISGFKLPKCGLDQWLVVLLGVLSTIAQCLFTLALQSEYAAPVSIVRSSSEVFLSFICQISIFNDIPDAYSLSGAFIVFVSVILMTVRQWLNGLPKDSAIRKKVPSFFIK